MESESGLQMVLEALGCGLGWHLQALTCATHDGRVGRGWTGLVFHGCFRDHSEPDVLDWLHFRQGGLIAHVALEGHCKIILISDWHSIPGIKRNRSLPPSK